MATNNAQTTSKQLQPNFHRVKKRLFGPKYCQIMGTKSGKTVDFWSYFRRGTSNIISKVLKPTSKSSPLYARDST